MRKIISIKVDDKKWAQLKARASLNQRTLADEVDSILEKYTQEYKK